jgi:hypothetical protein
MDGSAMEALESQEEHMLALASAQEAIAAAFTHLVTDGNDKLLKEKQPQPVELNLLYKVGLHCW